MRSGWLTARRVRGSGGAVVLVVGCVVGVAVVVGFVVWVVRAAPTVDAEARGVVAPVDLRSWITPSSEASLQAQEPGSGRDLLGRSEVPQDNVGVSVGQNVGEGSEPRGGGSGGSDLRSAQGQTYTWHDGDRVLEVVMQSDLVVPRGGVITSTGDIARRSGSTGGDPVFREVSSGALMALPGGVLLVLDSQWSPQQVAEFFAANDVSKSAVSELVYAVNGFFIDTEAGLQSLSLANDLAVQDGVELSSPNWWRDTGSK